MYAKQKQVIDSFVRVQSFLADHPAPPPATYAGPAEILDDAVRQLRTYAGDQVYGRLLTTAEVKRQEQQMKRIVDRHMRPIVTIARSLTDVNADIRLQDALKLPRSGIGVAKLLAAADAMIKAARRFEATFVSNGRPADFLAQFEGAVAELNQVLGARGTLLGTYVGAKKGIWVMLRRGRRAVDRLDAVVRVAFEGNDIVLERWRIAKRVQAVRGGGSSSATEPTIQPVDSSGQQSSAA